MQTWIEPTFPFADAFACTDAAGIAGVKTNVMALIARAMRQRTVRRARRTALWKCAFVRPAARIETIPERRYAVLYYAAVFLVIALVAALFGFGGIAAGAAEIAKILFYIFILVAVISLVVGIVRR